MDIQACTDHMSEEEVDVEDVTMDESFLSMDASLLLQLSTAAAMANQEVPANPAANPFEHHQVYTVYVANDGEDMMNLDPYVEQVSISHDVIDKSNEQNKENLETSIAVVPEQTDHPTVPPIVIEKPSTNLKRKLSSHDLTNQSKPSLQIKKPAIPAPVPAPVPASVPAPVTAQVTATVPAPVPAPVPANISPEDSDTKARRQKVKEWLRMDSNEQTSKDPPLPFDQKSICSTSSDTTNQLNINTEIYNIENVPHWGKDYVKRSFNYKNSFIDTYCDVVDFNDALNNNPTFNTEQQSLPINYAGFIAVFSDPKSYDPKYPNDLLKDVINKEGIWLTFGCHPRHAHTFSKDHVPTLQLVLSKDQTVAVGPCGLNSSLSSTVEQQTFAFKSQVELAVQMKLPIVLHCSEMEDECMQILKKHAPRTQMIHIQGFTGSKTQASQWLSVFSRVYFGLTPVIADKTVPSHVKEMVRFLPMNRILLESGAPDYVPEMFRKYVSMSHFGFALFTAKFIGEVRRLTTDEVFKACRENTKHVYGM